MGKSMTAIIMSDTNFYSGEEDIENTITLHAGAEVDVVECFYSSDDESLWATCSTTMDGEIYSADLPYSSVIPKIEGITDKVFSSSK
jgi:hypothetical protein